MTTTSTPYEFRVVGHLDDRWGEWFGELTVIHNEDGTTTLVGQVTDQARLHGMLARIRDVGATLVSLQVIEQNGPEPTWRFRQLEPVDDAKASVTAQDVDESTADVHGDVADPRPPVCFPSARTSHPVKRHSFDRVSNRHVGERSP